MHISQRDDIMSETKRVMNIVNKNKGIITSKQLDDLEIHRQYLSELVKQGILRKMETYHMRFCTKIFSLRGFWNDYRYQNIKIK